MNTTLARQVRKFFGSNPPKSKEWLDFLDSVSKAYEQFDKEKKQAGRSLVTSSRELSEQRFRQLAENIQEVLWITDHDKKKMIYISPAYEKIWGRTCQSLYENPSSWIDAVHYEDKKNVLAAMKKQAMGTYDEEYRIIRPDKSIGWIRDRAYLVKDSQGEVTQIVGIAQDTTEQKIKEEETLRLSEKMRLVLETTDEGIYGLDITGKCILINASAAKMLGYKAEELMSKELHNIMHHKRSNGTPYPVNECMIHQTLRTGKGCREDGEVFWRKDGTAFSVEYSSYPIVEKGEIKGVVVTFSDITKRKMEEIELKKLSRIVELTSDNVVITDMNGNIIYVNPAFEKDIGYYRNEVYGKTLRILKSGNHNKEFYENFWKKILSGQQVFVEFTNRKKDGSIYVEEQLIIPIKDDHGNITNFVATGRNVTERKQTQDILKAKNEELEKFNKFAIGRELKMVELKNKIRELEEKLSQKLQKD